MPELKTLVYQLEIAKDASSLNEKVKDAILSTRNRNRIKLSRYFASEFSGYLLELKMLVKQFEIAKDARSL